MVSPVPTERVTGPMTEMGAALAACLCVGVAVDVDEACNGACRHSITAAQAAMRRLREGLLKSWLDGMAQAPVKM